eukprot:scaffold97680_cov67-Phaeocystis_antarctica.AAC.2
MSVLHADDTKKKRKSSRECLFIEHYDIPRGATARNHSEIRREAERKPRAAAPVRARAGVVVRPPRAGAWGTPYPSLGVGVALRGRGRPRSCCG